MFQDVAINPYSANPSQAWVLKALRERGIDVGPQVEVSGFDIGAYYNVGQVPGAGLPGTAPLQGVNPVLLQQIAAGNPQLSIAAQGGRMLGGFGSAPVEMGIPTAVRGTVLGFDSAATIAAAASQNVTSRPQRAFRPEKLVVPGAIAPSFTVDDLRIGNISQWASADVIPAEMFTPDAQAISLRLDTCDPALDVVIRVTNISGGAVRFRAGLTGTSLK